MPELPEVETIRLGLQKRIIGKTLENIEVLNPKTFIGDPKKVQSQKVLNIERKAKMLLINLSGKDSGQARMTLVFHLKMTGQLIWIGESRVKSLESRIVGGHPTPDMRDQMPNSSTRVIFEFSDRSKLYFNDQRKFGWVKVIQGTGGREQVTELNKILGHLGPEPLEQGFTWQSLKSNLLKHKSQPVKLAIMDQSTVSGIGNIYASEALFLARIDPKRKVNTLLDTDFKNLFQGIQDCLKLAIKHGGSTRAHFVDAEGRRGYYLDYANVYGKEGYKCNKCPGNVQKIALGGRGTYFCPSCQK